MIQGIDSLMLFKVRCIGIIQVSFQFSCFVCFVLCCKQLFELTQQKYVDKNKGSTWKTFIIMLSESNWLKLDTKAILLLEETKLIHKGYADRSFASSWVGCH